MKILIKTLEHTDYFEILRTFKSADDRIFMLSNIGHKFILIELIAFNFVTVINEIAPEKAGEWSVTLENETIEYDKLVFKPIDDSRTALILDQHEYFVVFKQDGIFYQLENAEFDNRDMPPAPKNFPFKMPFPGAVFRLLLKQKDPIENITIDEYLDRIRHVGFNNLTAEEKHGLDILSQL